jgi:DNA-binding LacI/PurR family transcriptional regulator
MPSLSNGFIAMAVEEAHSVLSNHGYGMMICRTGPTKSGIASSIELLRSFQGCGLLIMQHNARRYPDVVRWAASGRPMVVVIHPNPGLSVDSVILDDEESGYQATRHLINYGHRRIAILSRPVNLPIYQLRVAGYRRAMQEAGIPVKEVFIRDEEPNSRLFPEQKLGYRETLALLRLLSSPTALLCAHNQIAMGALLALRELQLIVPKDISLVTFDHVDWIRVVEPALTSIGTDGRDVGGAAARLILDQLKHKGQTGQTIRLSADLIPRDSVASPNPKSSKRGRDMHSDAGLSKVQSGEASGRTDRNQ